MADCERCQPLVGPTWNNGTVSYGMTRITERLRAGDRLLLDGGTGSELQRRGVDVLLGSTGRLKAWSATANLAAGDVVRQVHQDYLRVGADIITSNNFWTSPSRLATLDAGEDWRTYADAAARNALGAREAGNKRAYVAGGIAPPALQDRDTGDLASDVARMGESAFASEIGDHARLLAAAGVDLILLEYLGYISECVAAVQACADIDLPLFVGIRHIRADGSMQYGESLADLAAELQGRARAPDAILLMCSNPEAIDAGLPVLREAADGPVGCYPNLGYNPTGPVANRPTLTNQRPNVSPDILQSANYPPARLAEYARRWLDSGAQIIGGCCASGPEHILALRAVVDDAAAN